MVMHKFCVENYHAAQSKTQRSSALLLRKLDRCKPVFNQSTQYSVKNFRILILLIVIGFAIMEFEKFLTLGKTLGLSGKDLIEFANYREEAERVIEQHKRDERAEERAHIKELKEIELKLEEQKKADTAGSKVEQSTVKRPKLPPFNDSRDKIDAYLRRFERFAKTANWQMKDWAISLSSLLTGKALEVYSRMPIDQANKYSDLKSALLHRYNLTDEGFRFKLRNAKRIILV